MSVADFHAHLSRKLIILQIHCVRSSKSAAVLTVRDSRRISSLGKRKGVEESRKRKVYRNLCAGGGKWD